MKIILIRAVLTVGFTLLGFAGFYLIAAFSAWDFNPQNWQWIVRFLVVFCAVSFGSGGFIVELKEKP